MTYQALFHLAPSMGYASQLALWAKLHHRPKSQPVDTILTQDRLNPVYLSHGNGLFWTRTEDTFMLHTPEYACRLLTKSLTPAEALCHLSKSIVMVKDYRVTNIAAAHQYGMLGVIGHDQFIVVLDGDDDAILFSAEDVTHLSLGDVPTIELWPQKTEQVA